jgi:hypothetical protein
MSVKLKPITENSWLVIGDTEEVKIGLLSEIQSRYVLMVKGIKQQFLDRKEVNKYFNEDIFSNMLDEVVAQESGKDFFINGFPIDFSSPFEVHSTSSDLPLYSKKITSDVYYSAGYYCLSFPKNWMPAYCPKLSTLETYKFAGPYKTEIEMRSQLQLRRKGKVA